MKYISKKEKTKQKILSLCLFLCTLLLLFTIQSTYAKYITSTSGDANMNIARWKILVNNQDIVENKELSNVITPVFEGNENIAKNVIAPTSEGYFDIVIDATNTDVSLKYEITTEDNENSVVKDLKISGYEINNQKKQELKSQDGQIKIENKILYNSEQKELKLRIYLKWNDNEEEGAVMDNNEDTKATTIENGKAKVTVKLKFTQLPNTSQNNE